MQIPVAGMLIMLSSGGFSLIRLHYRLNNNGGIEI